MTNTVSVTPFGYGVFAVLVAAIALAVLVMRRVSRESDEPVGCIGGVYFGTVVVCIATLFAASVHMFAVTSHRLITHPKYEAVVVDVSSEMVEREYEDSDGFTRTRLVQMHTPILEFTDADGRTVRHPGNIRSGRRPVMGDRLTIAFENGEVSELSLRSLLIQVAIAVFVILLGLLTLWMSLFAAGRDTERVKGWLLGFIALALIPGAMFAMMAGMSWAVWDHHAHDGDMPIWAQAVAIFFSLTLALSLLGYAKMIFETDTDPSEGETT